MTAENFCYWLQATFEIMDAKTFNEKQVEIIKNHLSMVFAHDIDPKMGDEKHQNLLNDLHFPIEPKQRC